LGGTRSGFVGNCGGLEVGAARKGLSFGVGARDAFTGHAVTRHAVTRLSITQLSSAKSRAYEKYRAMEMNKRISALGADWKGLLSLHQREGGTFNNVNWATLASKLGRLRMREMREMKRDARVSEWEEC